MLRETHTSKTLFKKTLNYIPFTPFPTNIVLHVIQHSKHINTTFIKYYNHDKILADLG